MQLLAFHKEFLLRRPYYNKGLGKSQGKNAPQNILVSFESAFILLAFFCGLWYNSKSFG
jgi:hypothetical protein